MKRSPQSRVRTMPVPVVEEINRSEEDSDSAIAEHIAFRNWLRRDHAATRIQRCYRKWVLFSDGHRSFSIYARQSMGRLGLRSRRGMRRWQDNYINRLTEQNRFDRYFQSINSGNEIPVGSAVNTKRRPHSSYGSSGDSSSTSSHRVSDAVKATALLQHCFQAIIQEDATWQQKLYFWRHIAELRAAHVYLPHELLVKAVIDAKGDTSRADTMLHSEEYCLESGFRISKSKPLPLYLQIQRRENAVSKKTTADSKGDTGETREQNIPTILPTAVKRMFMPSLSSAIVSSAEETSSSRHSHQRKGTVSAVDRVKQLRKGSKSLPSSTGSLSMGSDTSVALTRQDKKQQLIAYVMRYAESVCYARGQPIPRNVNIFAHKHTS